MSQLYDKEIAKKDTIYKWLQMQKSKFPIHPVDKEQPVPRKFIGTDFVIYLLCYMFPPLVLLLNDYMDYPMEFHNHPILKFVYNKFKHKYKKGENVNEDIYSQNKFCKKVWVVLNTSLLLMCTIITIATNTLGHFLLVERFGTPFLFLLRCISNSFIAASNEKVYDFSYLKNYPIHMGEESEKEVNEEAAEDKKDEIKKNKLKYTAHDFYSYITSQISYQPKINWTKKIHLISTSALISFIPIILAYSMRHECESLTESLIMWCNILLAFPISVVLFRGFFQSFSLFMSMKKTMERLIIATYSEKFSEDKMMAFTPSNTTTVSDKAPEKIILNLTHPDNLRAYFYTHDALTKRENSLEAKLINFTGSVVALVCSLMLSIIFLNYLFENDEKVATFTRLAELSKGEFAMRMMGNIISIKNADLIIMGYLVLVLVGSMILIAVLGSSYNYYAKNAQAQYLRDVHLSATLELECDGWKEKMISKERKLQLETVIKLIDPMSKHFDNHINDLGILGLSYSSIYWYMVAFFSANFLAIARKQIKI